MAGDWIKMRSDLFTHPKVVRISSALKADRLRTVGGLMSAWCLFDAHSVDGILHGYTSETLDDHLCWPGFSAAVIAVKWLADSGESLSLPEFETHNGVSAKRRAQDADRKQNVRKMSASDADKMRTREEKRREEEEKKAAADAAALAALGGTKPPSKKSEAVELDTWLATLGEELPIPADDPIFAYAEKVGLPLEFLELSWHWFCESMRAKRKRQAGWRQTYRNAVQANWGRLWAIDREGQFFLTTEGKQAQRALA